jgi:hypothetical protein
MAESTHTTQIKESLAFVFEDPRWIQKLLVAALLIFLWFIPFIPMIILLGYMARIMRGMIQENKDPFLPEWTDFNQLFRDGFQLMVAYLVYTLPIMLILAVGYGSFFLPFVTTEMMTAGEGVEGAIIIIGYLIGLGLMGIGFLVAIAGGIFIPVAACRVVVQGRIRAAFDLREIWKVFKANWSGFVLAYLVLIGGSMMAYYGSQLLILTIILCCLYPLVLSLIGAYLSVVSSALFANAYRDGLAVQAESQGS